MNYYTGLFFFREKCIKVRFSIHKGERNDSLFMKKILTSPSGHSLCFEEEDPDFLIFINTNKEFGYEKWIYPNKKYPTCTPYWVTSKEKSNVNRQGKLLLCEDMLNHPSNLPPLIIDKFFPPSIMCKVKGDDKIHISLTPCNAIKKKKITFISDKEADEGKECEKCFKLYFNSLPKEIRDKI